MPGAILLVQTAKTNYLGAMGWADIRGHVPIRADHAFRIGSITKMFVGLTVIQLMQEGRLTEQTILTDCLPEVITKRLANSDRITVMQLLLLGPAKATRAGGTNSDRITVMQLLQHRSGIPDFLDDFGWILRYGIVDRRGDWPALRHLQYVYDKPARFAPGQRFEYSNTNFLLLGLIIDHITGHSHAVEIRKRFLDPLRLTNTYYEGEEPARGDLAHGYERILGFSLDTASWTPLTGGSMGMVSTVADLAAFVRAVTSRVRMDGGGDHVFPAFSISTQDGRSVFLGHGGAVPGYLCFAWRDPANDITIVWFGSSRLGRAPGASGRVSREIQKALIDLALAETLEPAGGPTSMTEPAGPANGSQPIPSQTNRTSSVAGSRR